MTSPKKDETAVYACRFWLHLNSSSYWFTDKLIFTYYISLSFISSLNFLVCLHSNLTVSASEVSLNVDKRILKIATIVKIGHFTFRFLVHFKFAFHAFAIIDLKPP